MTNVIRNCTFAFKCDKKWEDLSITPTKDIRFCHACQREVHFCHTDAQLRDAIALNRCVAIKLEEISGPKATRDEVIRVGFVDDMTDIPF